MVFYICKYHYLKKIFFIKLNFSKNIHYFFFFFIILHLIDLHKYIKIKKNSLFNLKKNYKKNY